MSGSPLKLADRIPTPEEFSTLFDSVGWPQYEPGAVAAALSGSLAGTVAHAADGPVAMGRVVGDGGKFFYLQDLIVAPSQQRRGVGEIIVQRLLRQIRSMAPGSAFVGVFATEEALSLYRQAGFQEAFGRLTGMAGVFGEPGPDV